MTDRETFVAALSNLINPEQGTDPALTSQNSTATEALDQSVLTYPSEADYPLTVVTWQVEHLDPATLRQQLSLSSDTPIEERSADTFFDRVTGDPAETALGIEPDAETDPFANRYRALRELLTTHLSDLKVYRIGQVEVDVYVIGEFTPSTYMGVATRVVET